MIAGLLHIPLLVAAVQLVFHTLAGPTSGGGYRDGTGEAARFSGPKDLAVCRSGDIFVADTGNDVIRKVTPSGVVTTFATGFREPAGIAADADCTLYVADTLNDVVKRVSSGGAVSVLATGFKLPGDVALGPNGILFVADTGNRVIRAVSPTGVVTTFASGFQAPRALAVDGAGTVYVADHGNFSLWRVSPSGVVSSASSSSIGDTNLAVADDGTVYLTDADNGVIRRLAAGLPVVAGVLGTRDFADGPVSAAHFRGPLGLAVGANGTLVVSEAGNATIRIIENGEVKRLAGSAPEPGDADGTGPAVRFSAPVGLTVDRAGTVYVGDQLGIRTISQAGVVTTIARGSFSKSFPAVDAGGNIYTSSFFEHVIYRTVPGGTTGVYAGAPGLSGSADGSLTSARFRSPRGLAIASDGSLLVADAGNGSIRKITPAGQVTTARRDVGAGLNLVIETDDTLYFVAEGTPARLQRLDRDGTLTTVSSFSDYGTLHEPRVARGGDGSFYMIDVNTNAVRRIVNGATEIVAGVDQGPGNEDGAGSTARFDLPREIASGPDGRLFLTDAGNHNIRIGQFEELLAIVAFVARPSRIDPGAPATLEWATTGATSARLDPGIGEVAVNGSVTVRPAQTTTYVLTVRGNGAEISRSTTVAVGPAPRKRRAVR